MGDIVVFHTKEEQEILRQIAEQEILKGNILGQAKNPHDNTIFEAIDDVDIEIQELLNMLEAKREENAKRSIVNQRRLQKNNIKMDNN